MQIVAFSRFEPAALTGSPEQAQRRRNRPPGAGDDDPQRILNASRAEAERERTRAKEEIPRLADAAVEVIWSEVSAQPIGRGTP